MARGDRGLRRMALEILDAGLRSADPYAATHRLLRREGDRLSVGELTIDLGEYERVFILGAGKASGGVARALEDLLPERISGGLISLKAGDPTDLQHVQVIHAAHPIPDGNSLRAGEEMMDLAADLGERDLVFGAITGGSSALLCLPAATISLADKQRVNELLLLSGADIFQINAVRKHLSRIKGGWLAEAVLPATLINLTVSDVVGDRLDYITGPTVPDSSTFEDARAVLDQYELWDRFPPAAADHIRAGQADLETPKEFPNLPLFTFLLVPGDAAVSGALEYAAGLGFRAEILTTQLAGEAGATGLFFAAVAKEVAQYDRPWEKPCALIAGGENVVTIGEDPAGVGGPNQEFALAAATMLEDGDNVVVASIDTDGTDGPTEAAGAIVDASTLPAARGAGFDVIRSLHSHDTHSLLSDIGDVVMTGPTGTNVNDLKLALIGTPRTKAGNG